MLRFIPLKPEIKVFGSNAYLKETESYSSPDWYQNHNTIQLPGKHSQISEPGLLFDIGKEPWRKEVDHYDFMIFDRDMNTYLWNEKIKSYEWINFIFGSGHQSLGTLISIYRFRSAVKDKNLYHLVLRQVGQHEFGHVMGLVSRKTPSSDDRGGLYQNHCLNLCTMKQSLSIKEALNLTKELNNRNTILCKDCQIELKSRNFHS